jgi:glucose-6-phosphate 1-epimerase
MHSDTDLTQLNQDFGQGEALRFVAGDGGFIYAEINTPQAQARLCTYAGQLLSYRPIDQNEDLFFLSSKAYYRPGQAIKGGVPICWPWFGAHAQDPKLPAHGFVRNRQWQVSGSSQNADGSIRLCLRGPSDEQTRQLWPHQAELELELEIGAQLSLSLITRNQGSESLPLTQALHTYFRVGDIDQVRVSGLDQRPYLDATDGYAPKRQQGDIQINGEVNRIYTELQDSPIQIHDLSLGRRIDIDCQGSRSAVVWNPWIATAQAMADLEDNDYQRMLCVETSNAGPDIIQLAPGAEHRLQASYRIGQPLATAAS